MGLNHALPSKQTTPLSLASPTSPLSRKRPSPWTSAYGGSAAKNLNSSSANNGIKAATIGQTTTLTTTHPSTIRPTDPYMLVQQAYYHLKLLPTQALMHFPPNKTTSTPVFSLQTQLIVYLYLHQYAHLQSSSLCSCLPHYLKSIYSITQVRVDIQSYSTQLEPSSNDASIWPAPHHQFLFTTCFRQHTWHMQNMQHTITFTLSACVDHNLEMYLQRRVFSLPHIPHPRALLQKVSANLSWVVSLLYSRHVHDYKVQMSIVCVRQ